MENQPAQQHPPQQYPPQQYPAQQYPPQPYPQAYPPQPYPVQGQVVVTTVPPKYDHYNNNLVQVHTVHPVEMKCQHCQFVGMTHADSHASGMAWISCLILALVGCNAGCCLIPFCLEDCQDATHTCSHCGKMIAYKKANTEHHGGHHGGHHGHHGHH